MKLYELSSTVMSIMASIEDTQESGEEPSQALAEALADWTDDLQSKVINIAGFRESLLAEAEAIKAVAKRQQARAKALEIRAEWLEQYVVDAMRAAKITEAKSPQMLVRVKAGTGSVEIDDESLIPGEFWKVIPETKVVSAAEVRKALLAKAQNGEAPVIAGARLKFNYRLEVK